MYDTPTAKLRSTFFLLVAALCWAVPGLAAADAASEVHTAVQHAKYAHKGNDAETVHLHLHHVINCLVGPNGGEAYDPAAGDPCKGQGGGALNDLASGSAAAMPLEQALALAKIGVDVQSHAAAQKIAAAVTDLLEDAEKAM